MTRVGVSERTQAAVELLPSAARMFPARGPFADGSSSKLTRCPSLRALKTAGFYGAAVEKPLLPTVVTDEPEASIPHQTLNRAVRHVA